MKEQQEFLVPVVTTVRVTEGWAAVIVPIYSGDDDSDRIVDIATEVVEVSSHTVSVVGNTVCVRLSGGMYVPCDAGQWANDNPLRYDDTHDLRNRLFPGKLEAEAHIAFTEFRFAHPQPWESFVRTI